MHSTILRRDHIHGVLAGVAVGDALGGPRVGLKASAARRMYGPPAIRFASMAGGCYSSDTHLMLMTAQALLNSRSDLKTFRRAFRGRLKWYLLSFPYAPPSTITSAAKCWLAIFGLRTSSSVDNNQAGPTAIFSTLAMNRTGHRLDKWVSDTTQILSSNPAVIDGCRVLCSLTDFAGGAKGEDFDPNEVLQLAIDASEHQPQTEMLEKLVEPLRAGEAPGKVAAELGWSGGISSSMTPTVTMSAYCWLRSPSSFEGAVLPAIGLGGDTTSVGAITGGLVGAFAGFDAIPNGLYQRLGGIPHGPEWIDALAERFSRWPHGEHDLHIAPAQSSDPPMQLLRNVFTIGRIGLNRLGRIPRRVKPGS